MRNLLNQSRLTFALEAHDAISAKIVEEAGFEMIWASGLTVSTALGHRDCNELSWTELCKQWEYMSDATSTPILVDGDTGFGNFNNVRQLVKKLCKIGIAGVCLEDKLFPKTNSFIGENQPLADVEEFCGKIRAGKDSQIGDNFCLIARTEAFIAGHGLQEALDRAYAYQEAGADAILVHSKQSTAVEIEAFCSRWEGSAPLVIVPTKYAQTPISDFEGLGISLVIWANHMLRAGIHAMSDAARKIVKNQSIDGVPMVSVEKLFDMTNQSELKEAEGKYLACKN